ncbi:lipase 1-like [Vanessa cardui]|uniref:lipase 1-like n=1 Tax=Vanessa cardui TaxID=171605 RepID=UPI001F14856B|nr:lipase 1-like [Vanessa cardui]
MFQSKVIITTVALVFILKSEFILANGQHPNLLHQELFSIEVGPNFTSLASKYGHPASQYEVITEDGYILTMFHLPGRSRFPVILMHGILDSSDTWIIRGENSLAITLANQGYDVWLPNSRGNRYSRRHVQLDPDKDVDFWKYSFHEIGYYDLPALIDRVLKETGAPTLTAIGHSQGNTAFYILGSTKPEYNEKVNVMIALAPICYLHHSPPPISTFIKLTPLVESIFTELNINEVLGDNTTAARIYRFVCSSSVISYPFCAYVLFFPLTGYDPTELEPNFFRISTKYFPAGISSRCLVHFLQVGHRRVFAQFDYGSEGNKALYNSTVPPPYDLSKVSMPIALLAARNDVLSTIPDVILLRDQLPNVVSYIVNPRSQFNHADYVWGRRMRLYLFPYIFPIIQRYNGVN